MAPPAPARLITIPFSHYCEKARWALDRTGVPYVEEAHLPMLHKLPTLRAGGTTVPVLALRDRSLTDSADILLYADEAAPPERKIYPRDAGARRDVDAIEALCNGELGRSSRLFGYHHTLPNAASLLDAVRPGLTRGQALLLPYAVPFVRPLIRRRYRITEERAREALAKIRRAFDAVGEALGKGKRRWIVGDAMTAADVTFAALAAPVLLPEGHPTFAASLSAVASALRSAVLELRATPAGAHALRLYREERHAKIA